MTSIRDVIHEMINHPRVTTDSSTQTEPYLENLETLVQELQAQLKECNQRYNVDVVQMIASTNNMLANLLTQHCLQRGNTGDAQTTSNTTVVSLSQVGKSSSQPCDSVVQMTACANSNMELTS